MLMTPDKSVTISLTFAVAVSLSVHPNSVDHSSFIKFDSVGVCLLSPIKFSSMSKLLKSSKLSESLLEVALKISFLSFS